MVIGPESTGKSTLSADLATALHTLWVPEYAREYLEKQQNYYTYNDLSEIATGQLAAEDLAAANAHNYLICDTDLHVIKVWSEHKYGKVDPFILQHIATRRYHAYILCDIDMPWTADPQREHPDPQMRTYFFHLYKDIAEQSGLPFTIVRGNQQQRLRQALSFICVAQ